MKRHPYQNRETGLLRRVSVGAILLVAATLVSRSASAQADLTGSWNGFFHEDQPERIPGPALGDYLGLPINDSARAFAEAWDASRLTIPEHQCRAHSSPYILRGPLNMRIWEERDPQTQQIVAIHQDISNFQQRRTIWMDGRPHPSKYAEHTWMGFSTGAWEGDSLVVTTTHIKQMWHRRNGLPQSDRVTLTEHYVRHGNILTQVTYTDDPTYLTEPLVKSTNMLLNPRPLTPQQLLYPCESVVEVADRPRGAVPHYLPGENPFLAEFRNQTHLPEVATRGGAQTMYPEFQATLKAAQGRAAPK
jgi:hypothetical protein